MSGGGGQTYGLPTINNSTSTTTIPSWLTAGSQTAASAAQRLLNSPVQAYQGPLAPGMTQDQMTAGNMIRNTIGAYQPYYDTAANMTQASASQAGDVNPYTYGMGLQGAINNYMNPYIGNVVDSVRALGQQNLEGALTRTADQAIGAKAFGGSRQGVQEGIATAQNNLNTNNLLAQLLSSGYTQATGLMGQDISNNLQAQQLNQANQNAALNRMQSAGEQMSNLGTANRAANVADVNNLLTFGGLQQQTAGNQMQAAYNEWLRQQNLPMQRLQTASGALAALPSDKTTNTSSIGFGPMQQQTSNPLMGGLGGGLSGAMMGAQIGSVVPGIGTGFGAAAGGLAGFGAGLLR